MAHTAYTRRLMAHGTCSRALDGGHRGAGGSKAPRRHALTGTHAASDTPRAPKATGSTGGVALSQHTGDAALDGASTAERGHHIVPAARCDRSALPQAQLGGRVRRQRAGEVRGADERR